MMEYVFDITNYLHELVTAARRAGLFINRIMLHTKSGNRDDCPIYGIFMC